MRSNYQSMFSWDVQWMWMTKKACYIKALVDGQPYPTWYFQTNKCVNKVSPWNRKYYWPVRQIFERFWKMNDRRSLHDILSKTGKVKSFRIDPNVTWESKYNRNEINLRENFRAPTFWIPKRVVIFLDKVLIFGFRFLKMVKIDIIELISFIRRFDI